MISSKLKEGYRSIKGHMKSVSLLWFGSLVGSGSVFFISILVARNLDTAQFGIFGSVIAMSTLLSIIASFGTAQLWLKAFGKEGWSAKRWIAPCLKWQAVTTIMALIAAWGWALFGPHDDATMTMLMIMSVFVIGQVMIELVTVKLQLEERYGALAWWQMLPNLSRLVIIAVISYVFAGSLGLISVAVIYALTSIAFISFGVVQIWHMQCGRFSLKGHAEMESGAASSSPPLKTVISETWPFGMSAIFAFIYLQIDIIMLKYMGGDVQAGYYNVAYIIITASMIFPNVLYQKFFLPKYHRWINHDMQKLVKAYRLGLKFILALGCALTLGVFALSWFFIPLLFGQAYEESVALTNFLSIIIPVHFVSYNAGSVMVAGGRIRMKMWIVVFVSVFNIILNVVLIPHYAAMGAVIATIVSYSVLMIMYIYVAQKRIFNYSNLS